MKATHLKQRKCMVIVSTFDGMSCVIVALKKAGRPGEFDLLIAIEFGGTARMISKAVLANLDVDIGVYSDLRMRMSF